MLFTTTLLTTLLFSGSTSAPCTSTDLAATARAEDSIVVIASQTESLSTLVAALQAADLVGDLEGTGPFTVFAPTNDAFNKLPKADLDRLLDPSNKELLKSILTYHVVPRNLPASSVAGQKGAITLNGQRVDFKTAGGATTIDGSKIVNADIKCSNGVIHAIDTIIMPSTKSIVKTAVEAGTFKTLTSALRAAQLVETLQGDGPFTVFAPTDAAFAKLPEGTLEDLLKPENSEKLAAILKLHVVSGRVFTKQMAGGKELTTLQGSKIKSSTRGGKVLIQGASIVRTDIDAANGVIHVIDSVLLPE